MQLKPFLAEGMDAEGCFPNLRSHDIRDFSQAGVERTTFFTSQVLCAASTAVDAVSIQLCMDFLQKQMHPKSGMVNYWMRASDESKAKPYPDDWDDTSCAYLALIKNGYEFSGEELSRLTSALIACESQPGGPYRTWLVPDSADAVWKDIDPAVNANIAALMSCLDVHLPGLETYLDDAIERNLFRSPYYPDDIPVLYFLTRARAEAKREVLISRWLERRLPSGGWGDAMRTAMAIASLCKLGADRALFDDDIALWRSNVSAMSQPYAFCLDPAEKGNPTYAGSASLTAAFSYEADRLIDQKSGFEKPSKQDEERIHARVLARASEMLGESSREFYARAFAFIERISQKDIRRQITLTPYRMAAAIGKTELLEDLCVQTGAGSLFGWAAYTLYDDVWDGDGSVDLLPFANLFHRRMCEVFSHIHPHDISFQAWWPAILDRVDAATAFELAHCRVDTNIDRTLPDGLEKSLIDRSLGHAIGPIAILVGAGNTLDGAEVGKILDLFSTYILARQLHDDAHDWESDFERGQLNAATFAIFQKKHESQNMRECFWMDVVPDYSKRIIDLCEAGRAHGIMPELFDAPLIGAKEALKERERTLAFLKSFPF